MMSSSGEASISSLVPSARDEHHEDRSPAPALQHDSAESPPSLHRIPVGLIAVAVLVVVVSTGTAWFVGGRGPDLYAARADLLVELGQVSDTNEAERLLTTQVVVIEGPGVLEPAAETLGLSRQGLDAAVSASLVEGSQVIRVEATDRSADQALRMTTAVVDQYASAPSESPLEETRAFVEEELDAVTAAITRLQAQLDQERAAASPDPNADRTLNSQIQAQTQRQASLQNELLQLELQDRQTTQHARVIAPPAALDEPVAPTPERAAALGLIAGLILAAGIVALGWRLRAPRAVP
jgi:capsular polysaccharide biosynthesis protein